MQLAIELRQFDLARHCVPQAFVDLHPFQANTLLAWVEFEAGKLSEALDFANKALDSSSRSVEHQEIALLARLLLRLREDEKALPLLEQVAVPGILNEDSKRLIECANAFNAMICCSVSALIPPCEPARQSSAQTRSGTALSLFAREGV